MSTQNTPLVESNVENKILMMPARDAGEPARFVHTVTQQDFLEMEQASRDINEARKRYLRKRDWIKAALKSGARIEPGVFTAELVPRKGGGYTVEVYEYEELVVR